jgi:hypothetical protein
VRALTRFKAFSLRVLSEGKIFTIIGLTVVLRGCETWSLTVGEERRLGEFGNRALKRMFGPNKCEVKLKDAQNYIIRSLIVFSKQKEDDMGRTCSLHGGNEKCFHGFDWKTSRKDHSWEIYT